MWPLFHAFLKRSHCKYFYYLNKSNLLCTLAAFPTDILHLNYRITKKIFFGNFLNFSKMDILLVPVKVPKRKVNE